MSGITKVLIKWLEAISQISSITTNVIKITVPQNGGHFERQAAIGRRNIHAYVYFNTTLEQSTMEYATSQYVTVSHAQ